MMYCVRARFALASAAAISLAAAANSALAAELPEIKLSAQNVVPACVTPGRLSAFLEQRNSSLDPRFATIAADYMRIGEELNIRWDTAFFQMLLETGNLTFKGDVSSTQNNFAGLGATGKKAPGESFPDVATGVKAHLQHVLLYAGEKLDDPVAERTRKVQEWGVLTEWQKTMSGPMTYSKLAKKWAPTSRAYARDIENVAASFYDGMCKSADPKPEMMALVRPEKSLPKTTTAVAAANSATYETASIAGNAKVSGADLAKRAVEEARASGSFVKSNLGAGSLIPPAEATPSVQPSVTILNAAKPEVTTDETSTGAATAATSATATATSNIQVAALGSGASLKPIAEVKIPSKPTAAPKLEMGPKCRVWTASYGGTRAIIIRAKADQLDNYTVLDVNEGAEKREAEAYIAAYAKGGETVGEYTNPTQALDKAFELCPEG